MGKTKDRAPFTREEVEHEIRRAALAMASMLATYAPNGRELAAQYLGVELPGYDYQDLSSDEIDQIPIERHHLYGVIIDAYDYAYQTGSRGLDHISVSERAVEAAGILTGFPQTDAMGEPSPLDKLNPQPLRQILDTFMARCSLDDGFDLTIRELALLANMGEPAVRTSLSSEGIKSYPKKKGHPHQVKHSDAVSWLMGRRGFVPSVKFGDGTNLEATMDAIFTASNMDFQSALKKALEAIKISPAELARSANVSEQFIAQLVSSDEAAPVEIDALERLALALKAPVPTFVGKAATDLLSRRYR